MSTRVTCKICNKSYLRQNKTAHDGTKIHKLMEKKSKQKKVRFIENSDSESSDTESSSSSESSESEEDNDLMYYLSFTHGNPIATDKKKMIRVAKTEDSMGEKKITELDFPADSLFPMIPSKRFVQFIVGPSGSGKSTISAMFIKMFKMTYPERKVILISAIPNDPVWNGLGEIGKIPLQLFDVKTGFPDITELPDNCMIIFDDIENLQGKRQLYNNVMNLMNQCMVTGRHQGDAGIYTIITNHQLMEGYRTKAMINEMTGLIFFPASATQGTIINFLKKYMSFSKEQIEKVMSLKKRYVMVSKTVPQYILTPDKIYLL